MSESDSLTSSDTENEDSHSDLEKVGLEPYFLEPTKSKTPVVYNQGNVSLDDDTTTQAENTDDAPSGRIGNKEWCICGNCFPMETSFESICCMEIPEIHKPRFSGS